MGDQVHLVHAVQESHVAEILELGLNPVSHFDDLGLDMRKGVVYCWLCREDDKMWGRCDDHVYLEVSVNPSRCLVAEMDFASLAMMYRQGSGSRPKNENASRLLAELYRVTSVPLSEFKRGIFSTPEVLVRGKFDPTDLKLLAES